MNLCSFLFERFSELTTITLHMYFLYCIMDTKANLKKQVIVGILFTFIRMVHYMLGTGNRPFIAVFTAIIYASFIFVGNIKEYTAWAIILVVLDGIVDAVMISIYLLFPNTAATQVDEPGLIRVIITLAAKGILFTVYHLITRKVDKEHIMQWRDFGPLLIVPIGCWIMLEVVFTGIDVLPVNMSQSLLAAGCVVLLLIVASTILLYNRTTADGKELAQSRLLLRTAEMTKDHIDQINDMYLKLSAIRHDLKNHFSAVSGFLNAKDYDALERYMADLVDFDMEMHEYVKHPVLNALIGSRVSLANNINIDFTVNMSLPEELPMTDVDLCILISNILDNAFEASAKSTKPRFIDLCTRVVKSYWVIACRNTTHEQIRFRSSGSLKSTKADYSVHGIGTKQIQKIAEKCGGFVTYRHENYEFTTLVTIKLPT